MVRILICTIICLCSVIPARAEWQYKEIADKLRPKRTTTMASTKCLDCKTGPVCFLMVAKNNGTHKVLLGIERGQFKRQAEFHRVATRFDDESIIYYHAMAEKDPALVSLIINNQFVSDLAESGRLVIEIELERYGIQQFEFDVSGLVWDWQ